MKRLAVLLAATCLLSAASAQWLDRTIWLTDSFPDLRGVTGMFINPRSGRLYIDGEDRMQTFDCATNRKHGVAEPAGGSPAKFLHYPEAGLVFTASYDEVHTFDDSADTLTTLSFEPGDGVDAFTVDPTRDKLYVANHYHVTVFAASTGQWLSEVHVGEIRTNLAWDSATGRVFCAGDHSEDISVIDCAVDSIIGRVDVYAADLTAHPLRREVICAGYRAVYFASTESLAVVDSVPLPFTMGSGRLFVDRHTNLLFALSLAGASAGSGVPRDAYNQVAIIDLVADTLLGVAALGDSFRAFAAVLNEDAAGSRLYVRDYWRDSLVAVRPDGSVAGGPQLSSRRVYANGLAWHPGLNRLYAVGNDTLFVVDCSADTIASRVSYTHYGDCWLSWRPSLGRLYVGNVEGFGWIGAGDTIESWRSARGLWLAAAADSQELLYLHNSDSLYVYDCSGDSMVAGSAFDDSADIAAALLLPEFGRLYLTTFSDTLMRVYDTRGDSFLPPLPGGGRRLLYVPENRRLFTLASGNLCEIDPERDSLTRRMTIGEVRDWVYVPMRNELWVLGIDYLTVFDCEQLRARQYIAVEFNTRRVATNAARTKLYCLRQEDPGIAVVSCSLYSVVGEIEAGILNFDFDVCQDGLRDKFYVGVYDGQVVVDCRGDSVLARIPAPGHIWSADLASGTLYAFSHDDRISVIRDNPPGVVEGRSPLNASRPTPAATLIRGVLNLPSSPAPYPSSLLDASGRRLLDLRPGPNDVSRLAPGVYFIHSSLGTGCTPVGTAHHSSFTKVVLTR